MKKLISVLFFCLAFFFTAHAHAQNINPGTQIKWPASCASQPVYSPSTNTCVGASGVVSNLPVVYPALCQNSPKPSWCSGSSADDYFRAACTQLPASGGRMDLIGLTGNIAASATCSTTSKQVITITDPDSLLTITQHDGGIAFPQASSSMIVGPGAGQCLFSSGGIHLAASANVKAIVANADNSGAQESFTAQGLCLAGKSGATVGEGLIVADRVFTNTTIRDNNILVCNNNCIFVKNVGGTVEISNNWTNSTAGDYSVLGSGLFIYSDLGTGCSTSAVNVWGGNFEHANGTGNSEIKIAGNGAGAGACGVYIHDTYLEKNQLGTPSTVALSVTDCQGCAFTNISGAGGSGASGDMIRLTESAVGRNQNNTFNNISNVFNSWVNTIDDQSSGGIVIPYSASPWVTTYYSNPGYVQPPQLPPSVLQSLGADILAGSGAFNTGSATFGTGFGPQGCVSGTGVTCVYSRTNSTAPPGYTFSQEVTITSNTNPSSGLDGVQDTVAVSYIAGQSYVASFYGRGDGSFLGQPTFLLGDLTVPTVVCENKQPKPFPASWTLYTVTCTATTSGTSFVSIGSTTPIGGTTGSTGSFWLGGFTWSPTQPLSTGSMLAAVGPYGVGSNPAVLYSAAGTPLPACGASLKGVQLTVSDASSSPTWHGAYASGGSITSNVICSFNGSSYSWLYQ